MNSQQICTVFVVFFMLQHFCNDLFRLFFGIGQNRTKPGCSSLLCKKITDFLKFFFGSCIDVKAAAAVGVNIDKAGNYRIAFDIMDDSICNFLRRAADSGNPPIFHTEIFSFQAAFFISVYISAGNPGFHLYPSSAATNSVIFRLMSGCPVRRDTGKSEVASP